MAMKNPFFLDAPRRALSPALAPACLTHYALTLLPPSPSGASRPPTRDRCTAKAKGG